MLSTCPSGLSHFQYWLIVEKWRFVVLMLRRATGRLDRSARSIASSGSTILERLFPWLAGRRRSEEHTSELQSLMSISYAVFCLKKKNNNQHESKYKN